MKEIFIGFVAAVLTAFLYLTGYGYTYGYYKFFGLSVTELELGFQEILVKSFFVVWRLLVSPDNSEIMVAEKLFVTFLLAVFTYFLVTRLTQDVNKCRVQKISPSVAASWAVAGIIGLGIAISSSFVGGWVAKERLATLPRATIVHNKASDEIIQNIEIDGWNLYHLETTKTTHFLILRKARTNFRWLVRVPKSKELVVQQFHQ